MTRYVGYIAMSLDGFIADAEGGVGWLDRFDEKLGDAGGYAEFIEGVDALVSGRKTHEQVLGWGWPYGERANYVLTRQPGYTADHVTISGEVETIAAEIGKAGHKCVWIVGGGETQRAALDAGMFDTLRIFIMPILLGGGLPLFAPGNEHDLTLTACAELPGGVLQIDYANED